MGRGDGGDPAANLSAISSPGVLVRAPGEFASPGGDLQATAAMSEASDLQRICNNTLPA
jgi:hypothetical protein